MTIDFEKEFFDNLKEDIGTIKENISTIMTILQTEEALKAERIKNCNKRFEALEKGTIDMPVHKNGKKKMMEHIHEKGLWQGVVNFILASKILMTGAILIFFVGMIGFFNLIGIWKIELLKEFIQMITGLKVN